MTPALPATKDIVLIGGGHSHALLLKSWGMAPLPGTRLTLINPGPTAPYSGMLPGHVAGHYARGDLDIDLVRLARFAGARIILGKAVALDLEARIVTIEGGRQVGYDFAAIDVGIHSEMPEIEGFDAHAIAAKPLDVFAEKWARFAAEGGGPVCVIGGGVAGAELAMAAAHRLRAGTGQAEVALLDRGRILEALPPRARARMLRELAAFNITLHDHAEAARITATSVDLADGRTVASAFTLGAAGARPHGWLANTGLATEAGYLSIGPTLQTSDGAVFATGDCADMAFAPRPKAGVFAVRAAPILLHNLRAAAMGQPDEMRPFRPQRDYLKLISLGGKRALAEKAGLVAAGPALWRWKNRIDQKFMDGFRSLQPMAPPALPQKIAEGVRQAASGAPLCGGCGAKLGPGSLSQALAALPVTTRPDIGSQPGDDAAILRIGGIDQILTTDHLRAFTDDPALMARIAAIHALGDCWAMGAAPQSALATVILPRATPALQARWLTEIMTEANAVFAAEGATIVGGHSSQGAELTLGFTVTGLAKDRPITLTGAQPGDRLILTKPIGTGIILAAEMQLAAPGDIVARAWALMCESSGPAARALAPHAHAMTDVTGFGLAGHLMNICQASGVAARLDLDAIALIAGAVALSERGFASSLDPENRAALMGSISETRHPVAPLLYDPQTAGGLLAAIPADQVETILKALGPMAAVIGEVTPGPPSIELL
jgi:selenide, water dikinase